MKIFKMNDCEWVAAETLDEAKKVLIEITGYESINDAESDFLFDDPKELSEEELDCLLFTEDDDNKTKKTFKQKLAELIASNKSFPCYFATTEW